MKRFEIVFAAFLLSIPFWWASNLFGKNVADFFVWREISNNPTTALSAQIAQPILNQVPVREKNLNIQDLELDTKSAISLYIGNSNGSEGSEKKILFKKDSESKLQIASLTKLMTAFVVAEHYDPSQTVDISKAAVDQEGDFGQLKVGQVFQAKNLLYSLLIASSNDAAYALAEVIGLPAFVDMMNLEAKSMGLKNTNFTNPMGLDDENNYSTSEDLAVIGERIAEKPILFDIISKKEFDLYTPDGVFHHKMLNTNELLGKNPDVIGGKTGYTEKAKGCLLIIMKAPDKKGYLVHVVLGSEDRFGEMEKMIEWTAGAYNW